MSSAGFDWVLKTDVGGFTRHFAAEALPVLIGGAPGADIRLAGCDGNLSIGQLDGVFFVQPGRDARDLRVGGEPVSAARRIADGELIEFGAARMRCRLDPGQLTLDIDARVTAGDTVPPDLEELAREAREDDELAITPISFRAAQAKAAGPAKRRRLSVGAVAAAMTFALLAVLAWFAFTAKSVELDFDPLPASVDLPGTWFKVRLADRYLLRAGEHRIVAQLPGYYPLDTQIEVGESADQKFELALVKLPGEVAFATEPEVNADVIVDGEPLGKTPLSAELRPGPHVVEFAAPRHLAVRQQLDVEGGGAQQSLSVPMVPNWAPVEITTQPAGATVSVDGEAVGTTPAVVEVEAGVRRIEVRLAGYNAWQDRIEVVANTPKTLPPVELRQADGRVEVVSSPSEASVSVDGEFQGRTPLTLTLRPGRTHRLTLSKPGYATAAQSLTVAADSGRRVEIELEAQYGEVEIASDPPQAEVWVDGRREAVTPAVLSLTAVPHSIEVRLDGFAVVEQSITPRPGFTQALLFDLVALDDTTGDGYPRTITTSLGQSLRLVPAGQFTMGSSRRDPDRRSNEVLRRVKLSRAFYLGTHEVTNAQFREWKPEHDSGRFQGVALNDDDQPVVNVTFDEVAEFLNWLSIRDGLQPVYEQVDGRFAAVRPLRNGYRLPTEAEWAWAARFVGREEPLHFPWGTELPPPDRSGNFADVSAADILRPTLVTYSDGFTTSAPVGSFDADEAGFFDLGGNVAEWIQDIYEPTFENPTEQVEDPLGPETGRFRVVRGASWRSATATELRLAHRGYTDAARDDLGFRIARNLE